MSYVTYYPEITFLDINLIQILKLTYMEISSNRIHLDFINISLPLAPDLINCQGDISNLSQFIV